MQMGLTLGEKQIVPRVCLVSPGHLSTNPRLVKEASALSAAGFSVSIVCGQYLRSGRIADIALAEPTWEVHTVPFGPSEASRSTYLRQTLIQRTAKLATRAGYRSLVAVAHAPISYDLARTVLSLRPADLYIAHYPAALPAAAQAARYHGTRYAYDAEDFHLGDWPDTPEFDLERHLVRCIEGNYLPGCAFVTAASPLIAKALSRAHGIELPTVVLNVFPSKQAPTEPTPMGTASPGPSLYWFSQTIGPNRGLECAVRAIGLARSRPHLYLRGTLASGYGAILENIALEAAAETRVHILQPAAPNEMEQLAAIHDLGLCSENGHTQNRQKSLTNKLFSYLLSGVPPLMSDTTAQQAFAKEAGLTELVYPIDDAAALANLVDRYLLAPPLLAAMRENVWQLGQNAYNWDTESRVTLSLVNVTIDQTRCGP